MAKERNDLKNEAIKINGEYIEDLIKGYTTLKSSGRESLSVELETLTVGTSNGERVKNLRYPARIITVDFLLTGKDSSELITKLNHLNNLLSVEEADFVFNDEVDKFYTGVPIAGSEYEKGRGWVKGQWSVYCADPFKYSVGVFTALPTEVGEHDAQFVINYQGTYPSRPILIAEFAGANEGGDYSEDGDCGYVAFIDDDENIIQIGNPDAIDVDAFSTANTLVNKIFSSISGWNLSGGKTYADKAVSGSLSCSNISDANWGSGKGSTLSFVKPTYGSGASWHGPILWKNTAGAINFEISIVHRLCVNKVGEVGTFECGAYSQEGNTFKLIAGIVIEKTASGTNGVVRYIVNGSTVKTETIDLSYYNTHFGYCKKTAVYKTQYYNKKKKKWQDKKIKKAKTRKVVSKYTYTQSNLNTSIKKEGSQITFKVGRLSAKTFKNTDIELTPSHNVSFHFGKKGALAQLHTNAVRSVKFTKNPSINFSEIANVFTAGDIVEADCNDASVYIKREGTEDGHPEPQYGALGNDWEDFKLQVGVNTISAVWSNWVNPAYKPQVKIMYNEVFI